MFCSLLTKSLPREMTHSRIRVHDARSFFMFAGIPPVWELSRSSKPPIKPITAPSPERNHRIQATNKNYNRSKKQTKQNSTTTQKQNTNTERKFQQTIHAWQDESLTRRPNKAEERVKKPHRNCTTITVHPLTRLFTNYS